MPQDDQPQQPRQPQKTQQVNLPPFFDTFTGKYGQPLQFILIGSAILTLFFYWIVPLFEVQNEALTKIVLLVSACASIFGYYSLRNTSSVYTLKVSSLLFMIAEAIIAIGFLAASAMNLSNIAQCGILMMLGRIIYLRLASGRTQFLGLKKIMARVDRRFPFPGYRTSGLFLRLFPRNGRQDHQFPVRRSQLRHHLSAMGVYPRSPAPRLKKINPRSIP